MKYTEHLNTILHLSRQEAERLGNTEVSPEHLFLGILRLGNSTAFDLLQRAGTDCIRCKEAIDANMMQAKTTGGDIPFSRTTERILRLSAIEAGYYHAGLIGSEHLLLSILRERLNFPAMYLKQEFGITYETIEKLLPKPDASAAANTGKEEGGIDMSDFFNAGQSLLGKLKGIMHIVHIEQIGTDEDEAEAEEEQNEAADKQPEKKKKKKENESTILLKYGRDLTEMAAEGRLDPVMGREREIQRMVQILSRRKKNNPVLTGDPGVGKSAIVEGLATLIAKGKLPAMNGKRIIALDMSSIVAGTVYRGQFEQRMKNIIDELIQHPEMVLFIDEIHTIIGAGNASGSLDAANILKPALARGEIQCIGATTTDEFRKSIERDGALERRFQRLDVTEPDADETLKILHRLAGHYEQYHHVTYTRQALKACVTLSERYLTERSFPDKAIDVMY